MRLGPCELWVSEEDIEADSRYCAPGSGEEEVDLGVIAERATQVMWAVTGRQFGVCTATVRPRKRCNGEPMFYGGTFGCCDPADPIPLHRPTISVDAV
mgnify:CR=1 FL=1